MTKLCRVCKTGKALHWHTICSECRNRKSRERYAKLAVSPEWRKKRCEQSKAEYKKNKLRVINRRLCTQYGISSQEYNRLIAIQQNKCALCGQEETSKWRGKQIKALSVDHCHKTGKIRALLCHACNSSLGGFKEDISLLEKAIEYLKSHANN